MKIKDYELSIYKIIDSIDNTKEKEKVLKAYNFANNAHEGQLRKSGDPYITHPIAVAESLRNKFSDIDLFISALLHDTVEDCDSVDIDKIYLDFGENIGFMVDSVTKTEYNFYRSDNFFEDERDKILYGGMENIGCILIKLADREHNLATLGHLPRHKQIKKSFESQALYLPLMNILDYNNKNISLDQLQINLNNYLSTNNITNAKDFKNYLLNTCFHNFSEEIFNIVYNNSNQVIWEITDKNLFDGLVDSGWFDSDSVEIKKIEKNGKGGFKVYFIFKSGSIFDLTKGKISILNSNFISYN